MPPGLCGLDVALPWLEMEKKKKMVCPKQNVEIMWKLHGLEGVCRGGRFCIIGEMASSEENSTGGYFKS